MLLSHKSIFFGYIFFFHFVCIIGYNFKLLGLLHFHLFVFHVQVDLFFYREPEETKEQEEEEAVAIAGYALPAADFGLASADWGAQITYGQ